MDIAWITVGFLSGWIGIEMLAGFARLSIPFTFNIACGFIGAVIAAHCAL